MKVSSSKPSSGLKGYRWHSFNYFFIFSFHLELSYTTMKVKKYVSTFFHYCNLIISLNNGIEFEWVSWTLDCRLWTSNKIIDFVWNTVVIYRIWSRIRLRIRSSLKAGSLHKYPDQVGRNTDYVTTILPFYTFPVDFIILPPVKIRGE